VPEETVRASDLRFESPLLQRRFSTLRDAFSDRALGGAWQRRPLRKLGNFIEEDWCRPLEPGRDCFGGEGADRRGAVWYRVGVLHYPCDWPRVFGLHIAAGNNADAGEWGVQFFFSVSGRTVLGEGLGVRFVRFGDERASDEIGMGSTYTWDAETTPVSVMAPGGPEAELRRLVESDVSLRATAIERFESLMAEVEKAAREHRIRKAVEGAYMGEGVPPEQTLVPLTPGEEAAVVRRADDEIRRRISVVDEQHHTFHDLLTGLIPFAGFWQ